MFQWSDNSIAYFTNYSEFPTKPCAFYQTWENPSHGLKTSLCWEKVKLQILCEMKHLFKPEEETTHNMLDSEIQQGMIMII